MKKLHLILLCSAAICGCKANSCPSQNQNAAENDVCLPPVLHENGSYESWTPKSGLMHQLMGNLSFDAGDPTSAKYLERNSISPWVAPELITSETAAKEKLSWASNRYVRWLGATSGTLHFPFYPDEWDGDLYVETGLRPKMNPSMAIRFYRPDGNGGRTWSEPLTTDLTSGYNGYRWKIPREYLSKDGQQLMRVSFPGSYFEGENRVSAKFVHFAIGNHNDKYGRFPLAPKMDIPDHWRIIDQNLEGYGIRNGDKLERYFVVPAQAKLEFHTAPSAWVDDAGKILLEIQTETEKKTIAEIPVIPGKCWQLQSIDLSEYQNEAIRTIFSYIPDESDHIFSRPGYFQPDAYISAPQIVVDDTPLQNARKEISSAKRIVVLAIDNLRADRLWNENKRRATTHLSRLADHGILGIVMGEGKNFVAMETSFLTGVSADDHKVYDNATFVKTSLNSVAESIAPKGWKNYFFTTSSIIDTTRGFAQGFDEIRALNKESITNTGAALNEVSKAISSSPENSLFYVHLSELRLPHRASDETFSQWAVPGYTGPVNAEAMNNIAVMRDPGRQDAEQFEAYYDAELAEMDGDIGEFVGTLDSNTLVVIFGTHGTSLGESTLGYEQGITPWELLSPFVFYMPEHTLGVRREGIAKASELNASILDIVGADKPENAQTIFTHHNSRPTADHDGMTATASMKYFYRIRREGVFTLFTTGLDGTPSVKDEKSHSILEQALREQIQ